MGYPESKALKTWEEGGLKFSIVRHGEMGHLCGYVRFPKRPVRERGYEGILTYVPVHGGITYAQKDKDGSMVYGFDTAHAGDWSQWMPGGHRWTVEEAMVEAMRLATGIQLIQPFELIDRMLRRLPLSRRLSLRAKAIVLDMYHVVCGLKGVKFSLTDNFGAMLNLLAGDL